MARATSKAEIGTNSRSPCCTGAPVAIEASNMATSRDQAAVPVAASTAWIVVAWSPTNNVGRPSMSPSEIEVRSGFPAS